VIREHLGLAPAHLRRRDLTDMEATRRVMAATAMRFGTIDVLVNVAAASQWEKLEDGDPSLGPAVRDEPAHRRGVLQGVLPAMLERGAGRIVNIGAAAAVAAPGPAWDPTRPPRPACCASRRA